MGHLCLCVRVHICVRVRTIFLEEHEEILAWCLTETIHVAHALSLF